MKEVHFEPMPQEFHILPEKQKQPEEQKKPEKDGGYLYCGTCHKVVQKSCTTCETYQKDPLAKVHPFVEGFMGAENMVIITPEGLNRLQQNLKSGRLYR